jgi:hypothetical protein
MIQLLKGNIIKKMEVFGYNHLTLGGL